MLKVALTHDVDRTHKTYQYLTHLIKAALNRDLNNARYHISSLFKKNPYWNFDEIVEIENKYNVKSTFFFLNESIKVNPFSVSNWKLSVGSGVFLRQCLNSKINYTTSRDLIEVKDY